MNYKILNTGKDVQLVEYVAEYVKQFPTTEILIGCDSQNRKRNTVYAIVIGLYKPGKGAHVLYRKIEVPRERDNPLRLMNEVWYSIEVAEIIREQVGIRAKYIDIDLNPDNKFKSNEVISNAVGWVQGMGYTARHKGNSPVMTYAADSICK